MKTVIFLGSKDIGLECLKFLCENQYKLGYELKGVLTNTRGKKIIEYCKTRSVRLINGLDEFIEMESCDIVISVQYHEILKKEHIQKAKEIIVNLHMAPLPEYRGCNQYSFAIINEDIEFGTTIHKLEEGIDSGPIIFEKRFPIPSDCWVEELYQITFDKSVKLFRESMLSLISNNYKLKPQNTFLDKRTTSFHLRKEIEGLKKIDLSWSKEKIEKQIRGTSMQGFESPYTIINNQKVHFVKESEI